MSDTIEPPANHSHRSLNRYFDSAIYVGFLLFVLALPFGYSTVFLYGGLMLALFGWVGRSIHERKMEWKRTPLDLPIAIFLVLALVASALAPHRSSSSLGYFWKLLRAILLFYAVIHSRLGMRWRNVVFAGLLAGGVSSALGLWYYIDGTHLASSFLFYTDLRFQEESDSDAPISAGLRRAFEDNGIRLSQDAGLSPSKREDEWVITDKRRDRKYSLKGTADSRLKVYIVERRLAGTFKMPNDLGAYLTILLPMTMGYLVTAWQTHQGWRYIGLLGGVLCLMTTNLALTLTRGAWIGVGAATLYIGIFFKRQLLWGLIIITVLSPFLTPKHVKERFQTVMERPAGFMSERPQWWKTSVQLIAKYPLFGIGLGRFRVEYQRHGPPDMYHTPYHAHNIYLQIAVEQGIPSLVVFLWMLFLIFRQLFALRAGADFWRSGLFLGSSGFLIAGLVYGLADHLLHQRPLLIFWFIIGLVFYVSSDSAKFAGALNHREPN